MLMSRARALSLSLSLSLLALAHFISRSLLFFPPLPPFLSFGQFKNLSVSEQEKDIDLEKKEKACAWFTNYWKLWLLVFLTLCAIAYVEEKRREEKRREEKRREITELYSA